MNEAKEENEAKEDGKDIFVRPKKKQKLKTIIDKVDLVCDKANKYINKGKIKSLNFTKTKENPKEISFASWKMINLSGWGC